MHRRNPLLQFLLDRIHRHPTCGRRGVTHFGFGFGVRVHGEFVETVGELVSRIY